MEWRHPTLSGFILSFSAEKTFRISTNLPACAQAMTGFEPMFSLRVAMLIICKKTWGSPEVFHLMLGGLGQLSKEIENPTKELRSYLPTQKLYDKGIFPMGLYYECKQPNRIIIPKVTGEEWKRGLNLSSIGAFSNERSNEHSQKKQKQFLDVGWTFHSRSTTSYPHVWSCLIMPQNHLQG